LCFILLFFSLQGQLLEAGCRVSSHLITYPTPAPQPSFTKYLISLLMPSSSSSLERELKPSTASTVTPLSSSRSSTESDASLESETSVESCGDLLPNSSHLCPDNNVENSGQILENSGLEIKTESNKNLRRRRFPSAISNKEM
jgi:hypothetical protein